MRLLEQQMAERRERILAAAREIIGERGYEALTMRDLARASRVTVPTIYNLVGGKEQVLFAAVEEQTERFVASIDPGHVDDCPTPAARMLSVVEACCRELSRQPRYYRSLLQLMLTSAGAARARAEVDDALRSQLARGIDELRTCGDLADWIEAEPLVDRLRAHLAFTSLQWAGGELTRDGLRAASIYEIGLSMTAATKGSSREEFQRAAREAQPDARASAHAVRRDPGRKLARADA